MSGNLGTGFAQSGFSNEPNVSPFNQWFSNAVLAVLTRLSVYPPGTGGGGGSGITSLGGTDASTSAIYGFTNTPLTVSGTLTMTLISQAKNTVLAGPTSGGNAQPAFRALVNADLPGGTAAGTGSVQGVDFVMAGAGTSCGTWSNQHITIAGTATLNLNEFNGTLAGLVPHSAGGAANFLRADGTYAVPPGGGTGSVTQVIQGTGITVTAGTLTATGTVSVDATWSPTWTGRHNFNSVEPQIVLGTSTGYGWVTGTHYPVLQMAGVGGIFGSATGGLEILSGGLYWNGTNYVYGQAGTGAIVTLLNGTLVFAINTTGTAGQTWGSAGTNLLVLNPDRSGTLGYNAQGNGVITWDGTGAITMAQPGGTAITLSVVGAAGNPSEVVSIIAQNVAGKARGLVVAAGASAADFCVRFTNAAASVTTQQINGDNSGFIGAGGVNSGFSWGTGGAGTAAVNSAGINPFVVNISGGQVFQISSVKAGAVLGTSTAYTWGTGTNYPILQMAGIGGIMGTATTGLTFMGGGLYFNGTNYIYGQAGTGIIASLGTGTFSVSGVNTSGTAAGTATPFVVLSAAGTGTSGYVTAGAGAGGLVVLGTAGLAMGTLTNTTYGGGNFTALFVNGVAVTGGSGVTSITSGTGIVVTNGTLTNTGTISVDATWSPTWTGTHTHAPAAGAVAITCINSATGTQPSILINTPTITNALGTVAVGILCRGTGTSQFGLVVQNVSTIANAFCGISLMGTNAVINSTDFELYTQGQGAYWYNGGTAASFFYGQGGLLAFQVNGNTSPTVQGYGPNAAAMIDMTPDTGTFTGTWGGFTTAPAGTVAYWSRNGNHVVLLVPYGTGSKSGAAGIITFAMPAVGAHGPPLPQQVQLGITPICINGATTSVGNVIVNSANATLTFQGLGGINFTGTANHSIGVTGKLTTIKYQLNP